MNVDDFNAGYRVGYEEAAAYSARNAEYKVMAAQRKAEPEHGQKGQAAQGGQQTREDSAKASQPIMKFTGFRPADGPAPPPPKHVIVTRTLRYEGPADWVEDCLRRSQFFSTGPAKFTQVPGFRADVSLTCVSETYDSWEEKG